MGQRTSVTFSGEPGAGKTTILEKLQKYTGWKVHHVGGICREHFLLYKKDNPDSNLSLSDWYKDRNLVPRELIKKWNYEATEILRRGAVILDSRFATLNSRGITNCLNLFFTAPLEVRLERRVSSRPDLTREQILDDLLEREESEFIRGQEFYDDLFGYGGKNYDYRNPKLYDLVINTKGISIEEELNMITNLLAP